MRSTNTRMVSIMSSSDLQLQVDQLLREFFYRELVMAADDGRGVEGILGLFDEVKLPSPSFTPKQFNIMWDQFSYRTRVAYIKNLISR